MRVLSTWLWTCSHPLFRKDRDRGLDSDCSLRSRSGSTLAVRLGQGWDVLAPDPATRGHESPFCFALERFIAWVMQATRKFVLAF